MRLRTPLAALGSAALALGLLSTTGTAPAASGTSGPTAAAEPAVLDTYLRDTWKSFTAMVDPGTGLVSDNVGGDLEGSTRAGYTSPTNIGAYLWSTTVAKDTGLIGRKESRARINQTLDTLATLEIHEPSGMFYNWYDPKTGAKLTTWPEGNHDPVYPFVSSVDNGWLATGLLVAARAEPALAARADAIREDMNFGCYYNPAENGGGQIRGGFWDVDPNEAAAVTGDYCGMGTDVWYTGSVPGFSATSCEQPGGWSTQKPPLIWPPTGWSAVSFAPAPSS